MKRESNISQDELLIWVRKSGKSAALLAERMGISVSSFWNKVHGVTEFTVGEANILKKELGIKELAVFCRIFGIAI